MSDQAEQAVGTYLVPAARLLTHVHLPGEGDFTACWQRMLPEDLWVRSPYDPEREGPDLLCPACTGTATDQTPAPEPDPEPTLL